MGQPFRSAVVTGATPTSTGTVDITSPGFGTPKAIIVQLAYAVSDETSTPGWGTSWGVSDGTNSYCFGSASPNNITGPFRLTAFRDGDVAYLPDVATLASVAVAQFDSWITDGVRLNFSSVLPAGVVYTVTLIGGDDLQVVALRDAINGGSGTTKVVTVGFEPDVIIGAAWISSAALYNWAIASYGVAVRDRSSFQYGCVSLASESGQSPSDVVGEHRQDAFITLMGGSGDYRLTALSPTSTGFTLRHSTGGATANAGFAGLVMNVGSNVEAILQPTAQLPGASTTQVQTWPGHRSGLLYYLGTRITGNNFTTLSPGDAAVSAGVWGRFNGVQRSTGVGERDNSTPRSITRSVASASVIHLLEPDPSPAPITVDISAVTSTGHSLTTNANAGSQRYVALSISEFEHEATGAGLFPLATASGTGGTPPVEGDGAGLFPRATGASDAELEFRAAGDALFAMPEGIAAGSLVVVASGAGTLLSPLAAATGELEFRADSAGSFSSAAGAATGALEFRASTAGSLPALDAEGVAVTSFDGTVSGVLSSPLAAATGELEFRSSAAGSLPLPAAAGTSDSTYTAAGAGSLPPPSGAGSARLEFRGTVPGFLPLANGAATGTVQAPAGTGSGTLPRPDGSGSAALTFTGAVSGLFGPPSGSGDGDLEQTGTSSADFPLPQIDAAGSQEFRGAAVTSLSLLVAAATGKLEFRGDVDQSFPVPLGDGAGAAESAGSGAGTFPLPDAEAEAELEFRTVADGTFPRPVAFGTDVEPAGCSAALLGSWAIPADLAGSWAQVATLSGSHVSTSLLLGSRDALDDKLTGRYDAVATLEGRKC